MKTKLLVVLLGIGAMVGFCLFLGAETQQGKGGRPSDRLNKVSGQPVSTWMNINNVAAWYSANGEQERNPSTTNSGLYYPRGTSTAVYGAGLSWGGVFSDGVTPATRFNGYDYNTYMKPGIIRGLRTGDAEDPNASDVRIWRIRKDYATATLSRDAAEVLNNGNLTSVTDGMIQQVRDQYAKDWAEWPWQKGAPFYDVGYLGPDGTTIIGASNGVLDWGEDANHNGVLDPGEDANGNGVLDGETPGLAGADQVIWSACNDIDVVEPWQCPESGMELQETEWGYNRTDALGQCIFKKYRLIYKGTGTTPASAKIDHMYLMEFSDIDLGEYSDDFAGCDTNLSMMFVYNGKARDASYDQFGLVPPADGYDFLQGPMVPGAPTDTAIWNLQKRGGFKNLPMTAAIYFAAGGLYTDPLFNYTGGLQWYQMCQGFPPQPTGANQYIVNPVTGQRTPFWLSGDPVTHTGWVDGIVDQPGDRRICLSSGPFVMALGDTQELVCAWVGGIGGTNISSVSVMKFNDVSVQFAYDNLFDLPKAPASPNIKLTQLDGEIQLDWDLDSASVAKTEKPVYAGGFKFEGYNIWQFPDASGNTSGLRPLVTYDVVDNVQTIFQPTFDPGSGSIVNLPVQLGSDTGVKRFVSIKTDAIRSRPLVNGQRYYFAVTAYSYSAEQNAAHNTVVTLESAPLVITAIPQSPDPGTRYSYKTGDTIKTVTDIVGLNDALLEPVIWNRTRQLGQTYTLSFDTANVQYVVWTLKNDQTGSVVLNKIKDATGTDEHRVPDGGFSLYVAVNPKGMKSVVDGNTGGDLFAGNTTSSTFAVLSFDGTIAGLAGQGTTTNRRFEIRFDTSSYAIRLNKGPKIPLAAVKVPFSVWDVNRTTGEPQVKMIASLSKDTTAGIANTDITTWAASKSLTAVNGTLYRTFDPVWVTAVPYPTGSNDSAGVWAQRIAVLKAATNRVDANSAIWNVTIANLDTANVAPPPSTTIVRFNKFLEVRAGDVKRISPMAATIGNVAIARGDVQEIKVFPNPYYGVNRAETDRVSRFVTFSHLPAYAVIRIYNLAGVLVRRLDKSDPTTQWLRWDLQNMNGLPVASGIYIAYIELRDAPWGAPGDHDLGTKTVKCAIIQEQQFLRNY